MRIKVFFQEMLFFIMAGYVVFLYWSLCTAGVHLNAIYSIAFILVLIAERKKAPLLIRLILIGVLASPIYFMIISEIKFARMREHYRLTFVAIKEKLIEDDIQALDSALRDFKYEGEGSIKKLLHDLQNPTIELHAPAN